MDPRSGGGGEGLAPPVGPNISGGHVSPKAVFGDIFP